MTDREQLNATRRAKYAVNKEHRDRIRAANRASHYKHRDKRLAAMKDRRVPARDAARKAMTCQVTGTTGVAGLYTPRTGASGTLVDRCHIKPKRYCTPDEANDPDNILELDVRLHRLFDGLNMAVAPDGSLMFNSSLPDAVLTDLRGKKVSGYTPANDRYMAFHRRLAYHHGFQEARA